MRDLLFAQMTPSGRPRTRRACSPSSWNSARPGHTVLDDKIYRRGFRDVQRRDPHARSRRSTSCTTRARTTSAKSCARCDVCADAHRPLRRTSRRRRARAGERSSPIPAGAPNSQQIADVCEHVPAQAPRTFHEALQAYWFVHLGVITELNTWDAFNPGHLDQHLYPFYRAGARARARSREDAARELLQCFWIKFNNQPAPPKVGVTAAESGTYTDFANINNGGLTADGGGRRQRPHVPDARRHRRDATAPALVEHPGKPEEPRSLHPARLRDRRARDGDSRRCSTPTPSSTNCCARASRSRDARAGGTSGCVETGAFGKEAYWLTGYFNLPKVLELALNDGIDPATGTRVGIADRRRSRRSTTFDDVLAGVHRAARRTSRDVKMRGANAHRAALRDAHAGAVPLDPRRRLHRVTAATTTPAAPATTRPTSCRSGIATVTDSLSAIRCHVFERRTVAPAYLAEALAGDFDGRRGAARHALEQDAALRQRRRAG